MKIHIAGREPIDVGGTEVELEGCYCGVGIKTDQGLFGIAQRDGGIEVMLDGELVWSSAELIELRLSGPAPVTHPLRENCLRCKHWLDRRGMCTAEGPAPGRPWYQPALKPRWCPGHEFTSHCARCGRDISKPVVAAEACPQCVAIAEVDTADAAEQAKEKSVDTADAAEQAKEKSVDG